MVWDEIQDIFGLVGEWISNAFDVMVQEPAGLVGIFLMPLVIIGFFIAVNVVSSYLQPTNFHIISGSAYCQVPHYGLVNDVINPVAIPIKIQCLQTNFFALEFASYYFQMLVVVFFLAIAAINIAQSMGYL